MILSDLKTTLELDCDILPTLTRLRRVTCTFEASEHLGSIITNNIKVMASLFDNVQLNLDLECVVDEFCWVMINLTFFLTSEVI